MENIKEIFLGDKAIQLLDALKGNKKKYSIRNAMDATSFSKIYVTKSFVIFEELALIKFIDEDKTEVCMTTKGRNVLKILKQVDKLLSK